MRRSVVTPTFGAVCAITLVGLIGTYFTFAAIQGDFGVIRRMQLVAEKRALTEQRDQLLAEVARKTNLTRRLSDEYLDLDLLDERTRSVLGYVRSDEIVVQ